MSIRGYDAWKLATPPEYEDEHVCEKCGNALTRDAWPSTAWFCERCDDCIDHDEPDPDYALEAKRDDLMWEQPEGGGPDDEAPF